MTAWEKEHAAETAEWHQKNQGKAISPAELAGLFFDSFASGSTKEWPDSDGTAFQAAFFETWWKAHPKADVEPVPADMVMASGSGLDPHITLKSALYQLDRVAAKRAADTKSDPTKAKQDIEKLLREKAEAPLGGLVGVDLVNVLEVNLSLKERYGS